MGSVMSDPLTAASFVNLQLPQSFEEAVLSWLCFEQSTSDQLSWIIFFHRLVRFSLAILSSKGKGSGLVGRAWFAVEKM